MQIQALYLMVYSEADELGKEGSSEPCFYKHWVSHGTLIKTFPHQPSSKLKMFHFPLWWSLVVGMYLRQKREWGEERNRGKRKENREHFTLCVCTCMYTLYRWRCITEFKCVMLDLQVPEDCPWISWRDLWRHQSIPQRVAQNIPCSPHPNPGLCRDEDKRVKYITNAICEGQENIAKMSIHTVASGGTWWETFELLT